MSTINPRGQTESSPLMNPVRASLVDVVARLDEGKVTSQDLVTMYLDEIAKNNLQGQGYNAVFQAIDRDQARLAAKQLDEERAEGKLRSPLHGVPIVVKDHMGTGPETGLSTTAGLAVLVGTTCKASSSVIKRLEAQGLLIIGKASMTVLHNMFYSLPRSPGPWNQILPNTLGAYLPNRPGGSSSGSAVSVAAGFAAASIGAETFGSIVYPASMNALYALKPTVGLVRDMAEGNMILSESFDGIGPMGKTAMDVAMMLDAIVPEDARLGSYTKSISRSAGDDGRVFRVAVIDPDRAMRRASSDERGKVEAEERAEAALASVDGIELVDAEDLTRLDPDTHASHLLANVNTMVGDDSCLAHLEAVKTMLTVDMYDNINRFLAGVDSCEVTNVESLVQWHHDHPEATKSIGGMQGNFYHLERCVAWKGDRTGSECLAAVEVVQRAKRDIEAFMDIFKLDMVIGGQGLSLLPALCGAPICTFPVGMYPDSLEPHALLAVGRPGREGDLLRFMSIAERTFGSRPLPPNHARGIE